MVIDIQIFPSKSALHNKRQLRFIITPPLPPQKKNKSTKNN